MVAVGNMLIFATHSFHLSATPFFSPPPTIRKPPSRPPPPHQISSISLSIFLPPLPHASLFLYFPLSIPFFLSLPPSPFPLPLCLWVSLALFHSHWLLTTLHPPPSPPSHLPLALLTSSRWVRVVTSSQRCGSLDTCLPSSVSSKERKEVTALNRSCVSPDRTSSRWTTASTGKSSKQTVNNNNNNNGHHNSKVPHQQGWSHHTLQDQQCMHTTSKIINVTLYSSNTTHEEVVTPMNTFCFLPDYASTS